MTLRRSRRRRRYNDICFLCQQTVEKYLKARLHEAGQPVPRIHDLNVLLQLVAPIEPLWMVMQKELKFLIDFAVAARYPGHDADSKAAIDAFKIAKRMRELARQALGLR